jgi:hypothetical protein
MLFHLKVKVKAIFSTQRQLLLCVARRHVCFVLKQSVTVTSLFFHQSGQFVTDFCTVITENNAL